MGTPKMPNRRTPKRVLKPVIEKKRRDRINQRLDELRKLLLENTLDMRLQNPKLEKAEILELTVDYIRKKASIRKENKDFVKDSPDVVAPPLTARKPRVPSISLHDPTKVLVNSPLYMAGFRECISCLASFMECMEPSQRDSFFQSVRHNLDSHSARMSNHPWASGTSEPFSYTNQLYPNSFVIHHPHASGQALPHPYPSPPYSLSPPPSPCYSKSPTFLSVPCHFPYPPSMSPLAADSSNPSSSSSITTSPTYMSVPCHFPFPSSLSPLASDSTSSLSFATSTPGAAKVKAHQPLAKTRPPTPLRVAAPVPPSCPPQRTLRRSLFQNQQHDIWRPW